MLMMPFLIHALSPLHAGTGQGVDVIDLPIARLKAMGIPFAPGSSIKGVLRDARRQDGEPERLQAVFGPDTHNASEHAGALVVGDARLLFLPVRSIRGTFAWVTSPLLLTLALRDLTEAQAAPSARSLTVPTLDGCGALVPPQSACLHEKGYVYLEDLDLRARTSSELDAWIQLLARHISPVDLSVFEKRFTIVDDETMTRR